MKVLLVSGEYPGKKAGGIGSITYHLCKEFDKREVEYKVVCTREFDFEINRMVSLSVWGMQPISYFSFGFNFKRFLEKEKSNWDVFHFHLPNALGPLMFSSCVKHKTIVTVHTTSKGYEEYLYRYCPFKYLNWKEKISKLGYIKLPIALEKLALRNSREIVAVSDGVKNELECWYGQENVRVIRNCIDTSKLHVPKYSNNDRHRILFVGRLVAQKGIFLGIDALARIKVNYEFLIVGTGPLRSKLEEYCRKKGVNARFLGYVEDNELYKLYSESDLLLLPSFYEGLPTVALEAAGSGLPIVAFRGARVDEIVCEENRNFIVETGNIYKLSENIEYLLNNKKIKERIGRKNREKVLKNFNGEKMANEYIRLYETII